MSRQLGAGLVHPGMEVFDKRADQLLTHGQSLLGGSTSNGPLDCKDRIDLVDRFTGERRYDDRLFAAGSARQRGDIDKLEEGTPPMRPA